MKFRFRQTFVPALLSLSVAGCNGDVFIDDYLPDPPASIAGQSGETSEIRFEASNWDILGVGGLSGRTYDLDGNLLSVGPLGGEGLLCMEYDDGLVSFRIERGDYRTLKIVFEENMGSGPFRFTLTVGNLCESDSIDVTFNPTGKYRVERVVYDYERFSFTYTRAETVTTYLADNSASSKPVPIVIYPYVNRSRQIRFYNNGDQRGEILGEPLPMLPIPDIEDERPVMRDSEASFVCYYYTAVLLPEDKRELSERVTVGAGEAENIEVVLQYMEYSLPYTLYAVNPATGKDRVFTGELQGEEPYNYFIFRKDFEK